MPRGRISKRVDVLRAQISHMESATTFGAESPCKVALGASLDPLLGGGLRRGSLTEIVAARSGDEAAASGFALAIAGRLARTLSASIVWVIEHGACREIAAPYAPGLVAHGIDVDRLVVVHTKKGPDTLWATEEALKCRAVAAVVTDLWRPKSYDLVASRRLVLAAARSGTTALLVPCGFGRANALSSAAQIRFEVRGIPSPHHPSADHRRPLPGLASFAVRLARIRAGPAGLAPFDPETFWPLAWDHEERWFCNALPVPVSALPRNRPHPATTRDQHAA